ncbi:MAG: LptF/LptG family permease, partial [Alphaproteobacteria bacterium]|nr:LptF/LptG family permease [Alphaproteobacteria bacterium]
FLFAVVAVTMVVLFTQSFRLLSFIIDNAGTAMIFIQLMGLLVPTFLPVVVPLSLGVAVLFVYHKFAVDSEIVVMRAAGVGPLRLALPVLALAGMATLFGYGLTTWLTPTANRELVELQYRVRDNYSVFMVRPGMFNDIASGLTFYVRARGKDGSLDDILIHDVRQPERPVTIMAESGQFTAVDGAPQVVVFKGKRQEVEGDTGRLSQLDFDRYVLDIQVLRKGMAGRLPDPREQSMAELLRPPSDPALRRTTLAHVAAELHQRLAIPLLALSFSLVSLTAVLVGEFNRRGMAKRIFLAAMAIVAIQAATLSMGSLIGKHEWLSPVLYLVTLGPALACAALLGMPEAKEWSEKRSLSNAAKAAAS